MKAGKLRQVITIQALDNEQQDSVGQPVQPWVDMLMVRADVEPLSGREYFSMQDPVSATTTRITIRFLDGVTQRHRVVFEGQHYDILDVIDIDMRHKEMQLMCRVGAVA